MMERHHVCELIRCFTISVNLRLINLLQNPEYAVKVINMTQMASLGPWAGFEA